MADLSDHIVFVTGAGAGIGAATAARYLAEGAAVVALDHRPERLEGLKAEGGDRGWGEQRLPARGWPDISQPGPQRGDIHDGD